MTAFLVIGALGLGILVTSLVVGDLLDLPDGFGGDVLSTAAIAGFLAAFGFGAALGLDALGTAAASVVGVGAGVAAGGLAGWLTKALSADRTDPTPRPVDLVGLRGTVVSAVPSEGYGEVSIVVRGHLTKLNARSEEPLAAGTAVTVTSSLSPTSVVVAPLPPTPAR